MNLNDIENWSEKIPISGCWVWMKAVSRKGYGYCWDKTRCRWAHRVSFEIANGVIPEGMHILHRCDNPSCVNPSHLYLGTNADNMRDRDSKGRQARFFGLTNPRGKLTNIDVENIRMDQLPAKILAYRYGVTPGTIYKIRGGHSRNNMLGVGPCVAA